MKIGKSCKTWIELPQLKEMSDIIRITKYLSKRCFDKILLFIDMELEKPEYEINVVFHHIDFLQHAFGDRIKESIAAFVLNKTEISNEAVNAITNHVKMVMI